MELVNLKKYYPRLYTKDTLIEVSDEVAEALLFMQRQENASIRKLYYHRAFYSLDCEDGIENDMIGEITPSPEEICIQREDEQLLLITVNHLHEAMVCLSPAQFRNLHARYVLGMKVREIADMEGVTSSIISQSLQSAIRKLRRYFTRQNWMDSCL